MTFAEISATRDALSPGDPFGDEGARVPGPVTFFRSGQTLLIVRAGPRFKSI
jgi:hypothetical protein